MTFTGKHIRKKIVWANFALSKTCNLSWMSEDGSSKAQLGPFCPQALFQTMFLFQKEADFLKGVIFNSDIKYDRRPSSKCECMTAFRPDGMQYQEQNIPYCMQAHS